MWIFLFRHEKPTRNLKYVKLHSHCFIYLPYLFVETAIEWKINGLVDGERTFFNIRSWFGANVNGLGWKEKSNKKGNEKRKRNAVESTFTNFCIKFPFHFSSFIETWFHVQLEWCWWYQDSTIRAAIPSMGKCQKRSSRFVSSGHRLIPISWAFFRKLISYQTSTHI